MYEISDDDDSFTKPECSKRVKNCGKSTILISSDEESPIDQPSDVADLSSESEDLPAVEIVQKSIAIHGLFAPKNGPSREVKKKKSASKVLFPSTNQTNEVTAAPSTVNTQKKVNFGVFDVKVTMPVQPYKCQLALMHKVVSGIKTSQNCILESPTGSGKTLALLCGVLAWQQYELNRISQEQAKSHAQQYFKEYPQLQTEKVTDYIASPSSKKIDVNPEDLFSKNSFGEKSIYQMPEEKSEASSSTNKRTGPYISSKDDSPTEGLVSVHKRRRQGSVEPGDIPTANPMLTPEKGIKVEQKETPEDVQKLYGLVENLRVRTSMIVDCSLPTIYYGARTHTQLQQVIKEFKRTHYCGVAKMSILSSRAKSCIREFNSDQWKSKDDMCRACVKSLTTSVEKKDRDTNCKYYDNRTALNHDTLPPAFDLEDLAIAGEENEACPYYAARAMAKLANIVFCPYNYLIDPSIRSSLQIDLEGSIVVIDEGHNIENICRDSASFQFTQTKIQDALQELEKVAEYRYTNQDISSYVDQLVLTLKNWNDWFNNQVPIVKACPLNNNKAVYEWASVNFVQTLGNHNIGYTNFHNFKSSTEIFCRRLREDPRTLLGVTQATGTLLESLAIGLEYLFRDECKHLDDYKPALESDTSGLLTLHLYCMNPGVVMRSLQVARCIVLASGTLTPMGSIAAELDTQFPLVASPEHVIPPERVWVGTVSGACATSQAYTARDIAGPAAARTLGALITRVCDVTPHGVLCFLPSYKALYTFKDAWHNSGLWFELNKLKHVFIEQRKSGHDEMMKDFYECVATRKGALLFAVYRGKVSEGMDFKDHQARAVICVGVPYLSKFETAVKAKLEYNNKKVDRGLLPEKEWMRVQAYRALNQAVGRCVRHRGDWGAVLLADSRYCDKYFTEHLSGWVKKFLGQNHHTYESLQTSPKGLAQFMETMKIIEE